MYIHIHIYIYIYIYIYISMYAISIGISPRNAESTHLSSGELSGEMGRT